jgi:hypothetical protein
MKYSPLLPVFLQQGGSNWRLQLVDQQHATKDPWSDTLIVVPMCPTITDFNRLPAAQIFRFEQWKTSQTMSAFGTQIAQRAEATATNRIFGCLDSCMQCCIRAPVDALKEYQKTQDNSASAAASVAAPLHAVEIAHIEA